MELLRHDDVNIYYAWSNVHFLLSSRHVWTKTKKRVLWSFRSKSVVKRSSGRHQLTLPELRHLRTTCDRQTASFAKYGFIDHWSLVTGHVISWRSANSRAPSAHQIVHNIILLPILPFSHIWIQYPSRLHVTPRPTFITYVCSSISFDTGEMDWENSTHIHNYDWCFPTHACTDGNLP